MRIASGAGGVLVGLHLADLANRGAQVDAASSILPKSVRLSIFSSMDSSRRHTERSFARSTGWRTPHRARPDAPNDHSGYPPTDRIADEALLEMVKQIRMKLLGVEIMVGLKKLDLPGVDLSTAKEMAQAATVAIRQGALGYAIVCGTTG